MTYLGEKFLGQASEAPDSLRHIEGHGVTLVRSDMGNEIAEASIIKILDARVASCPRVHDDEQDTRWRPCLHGVEPPLAPARFHVRDGRLQDADIFLRGPMYTKRDLKIVSLRTNMPSLGRAYRHLPMRSAHGSQIIPQVLP